MTDLATTIDLIRHGEPEGGTRIRGWRDDPLSERGWRQMWSAVGEASPWSRVVSSPLLRCASFARQMAHKNNLPLHQDQRLKELGFGEWEGLEPTHLYESAPEAISSFWADPTVNPPPGGEPFHQFQQRVIDAWQEVWEGNRGDHLLLVVHGAVIRMLIAHVLGMPARNLFRMEVPYASVSRIRIEENGVARLTFHCGRLGTDSPGAGLTEIQ